jgi:hypothetical protein
MSDRGKLTLRAAFESDQRYSSGYKVASGVTREGAAPSEYLTQKSMVGIAVDDDDESVSSYDSDDSYVSQDKNLTPSKPQSFRGKGGSRAAQSGHNIMGVYKDSPDSSMKMSNHSIGSHLSPGHKRVPSDHNFQQAVVQPSQASSRASSRANSVLGSTPPASRRNSFDSASGLNFQPIHDNESPGNGSPAVFLEGLVPTAVHHMQITPAEESVPKHSPPKGYMRSTQAALPSRRHSITASSVISHSPSTLPTHGIRRTSFSGDRSCEDVPISKTAQRLVRSGVDVDVVDSLHALLDSQCLHNGPHHTKQTMHSIINTVAGHGAY